MSQVSNTLGENTDSFIRSLKQAIFAQTKALMQDIQLDLSECVAQDEADKKKYTIDDLV